MEKGNISWGSIKSSQAWEKALIKAKAGDHEFQFMVGETYIDGLVDDKGEVLVEINASTGIYWLRKAAKGGSGSAQMNLGYYLETGLVGDPDSEAAMKWYKKALRSGSPCAATNIATVYRDRGNHRRAFFWYSKACQSGDHEAGVEIGKYYLSGRGVRKNTKLGIEILRKVIKSDQICEAGREEAMFQLGLAYLKGNGVRQSHKKAAKWLLLANRDGDHKAAAEILEEMDYQRHVGGLGCVNAMSKN